MRQAKRESFQAFTRELQECSPAAAQRKIKLIIKAKKGYTLKHTAQGATLTTADFTTHYADSCTAPRPIQHPLHQLKLEESFLPLCRSMILRATTGKALGPDLVPAEALQAHPSLHAVFLTALWGACSRLRATPTPWRQALLVPLHKKGDRVDPANYRPIALLSHPRKVIDATIDKVVRRQYEFHRYQLGFRPGHGTELALLRCSRSISIGNVVAEVLDLKAAYDRVPRDKLLTLLDTRLPEATAHQIRHLLEPIEVQTVGDVTSLRSQIGGGSHKGPRSARHSTTYLWTRSPSKLRRPNIPDLRMRRYSSPMTCNSG